MESAVVRPTKPAARAEGTEAGVGDSWAREHGVPEYRQELPDNIHCGLGKTLGSHSRKDTAPPLKI